jgi:hypothetical protein
MAPFPGRGTPLEEQMADAGPIWAEISRRRGPIEPDLDAGNILSAYRLATRHQRQAPAR